MNVADFIRLKYKDIVDGEICFVRQKTARTAKVYREIHAVVTDNMQRIIDHWGNRPNPEATYSQYWTEPKNNLRIAYILRLLFTPKIFIYH